MDPILAGFRRVHLLKVDPRSPSLRIDNRTRGVPFLFGHLPGFEGLLPRREARRRGLVLVVAGPRPETCHALRIPTADARFCVRWLYPFPPFFPSQDRVFSW